MNQVFIPVPTNRLPTQFEIQRAICNRQEQLQPTPKVEIPKMEYKSSLHPSVGMFNLLTKSIEKYLA